MTSAPLKSRSPFTVFIVLATLHLPLAIAIRNSPALATVHAWLTVMFGIALALTSNPRNVACACAYIAAAEILWRMSSALVFWEMGKLTIAIMLIISIVRRNLLANGGPAPLYFLLLVPSAMITISSAQLEWARQELTFNMSGPLVLMLSVWFFRNVQWDSIDMTWVLLFLVLPIFTASVVGVHYMSKLGPVSFGGGSNFIASAGYGPNQVSTVLGLGAYACFLLLTLSPYRSNLLFTGMMGAGLLGFAAHSAITFSRGGLYSLASGVLGSFWFLLATPKARIRLILAAVVFVTVGGFYILPNLDRFTAGALSRRLEDSNTSGRSQLMENELQFFWENPIFGVGPGKTSLLVEGKVTYHVAAHTEFTRMLADHGIFGLAALVVLGVIAMQNIKRNDSAPGKAISVGLMMWVAMTMLHAAMRLAAPGFIFGLAAAKFISDRDKE